MTSGLVNPVELALLEAKTTDQRFNRAVLRIQRHEGGVHIRYLHQSQLGIVYRPNPNQIADVEYVSGSTGSGALSFIGDEAAGPFHAIPVDGAFKPTLDHDIGLFIAKTGDDSRLKRITTRQVGQILVDLIVTPGRLFGLPQALFGASVTVTGVVVHEPLEYRIISRFLHLGGHCGVDIEPLGVGVVTILFDHELTHHFTDIGRIQYYVGSMIPSRYRFFFGILVLFLGNFPKF